MSREADQYNKFWAIALALIVVLTAAVFLPPDLGQNDLTCFWVASRMFISGVNPYDLEIYTKMMAEQGIFIHPEHPASVWNPPWAFSVFLPLSLFTLELLTKVWFVCVIGIVALTVHLLNGRARAYLIAFSFYPLFLTVLLGQLSPLVLLPFGLFLYIRNSGHSNDLLAGFILAFTTWKPHLLYLFYLYLFLNELYCRRFKLLAGFLTGFTVLAIAPVIFQPDIYSYFAETMGKAPSYWFNPTLGSWLAHLVGAEQSSLTKLAPTLIAALGVSTLIFLRKHQEDSIPDWLLPLSILTTPYAWAYDFLLLIPTVASIAALQTGTKCVMILLFFNLVMFLMAGYQMHLFVWYPIAILGLTIYRNKLS